MEGHRFSCACDACSIPAAAVADSDVRRLEIHQLLESLSLSGGSATVKATSICTTKYIYFQRRVYIYIYIDPALRRYAF